MKKIFLLVSLLIAAFMMSAQKGYEINVKFKQPYKEESLLMGRYFGKMGNRLRFDTAYVAKDGSFTFKKTEPVMGGIYFFIFNNNSKSLDFLMSDGMKMDVLIDTLDQIKGTVFKGSLDNTLMQEYHLRDIEYRKENEKAIKQLSSYRTKADSTKVYDRMVKERNEHTATNRKITEKHPNTLYALITNAMDRPTPPEGPHYKADGKTLDSFYNYRYTKANYWDKFDLMDDRLAYTPIYEEKLHDYFENYVFPVPDSVQYEADVLLAMTRPAPDMFKYTLHWLANYTRTKKVMGMDETFVYLVDKYYAKGDAVWLDTTQLRKNYLEPAEDMSYTKIGKVGQDLPLNDLYTYQPRNLHSVKADYTILVIWEPTCGHCQKEIPAIDSTYNALKLKEKNVVIYSIPKDKDLQSIQKGVEKLHVKNSNWMHNIPMNEIVRYDKLYNAKMSPTVFILDKDKKIIGKNIDHNAIGLIIDRDIALKSQKP